MPLNLFYLYRQIQYTKIQCQKVKCIQCTKVKGYLMKNSGRQVEIDIAKGIAIIFMVLVHTVEYFFNGSNAAANSVIEFLGSPPAAPVFMFALGIGVVYSRNNSAEHLAMRGCQMFIMSYIYNLLVYALPYLIQFFRGGDEEYLSTAIVEFSNVDILQFASLAFLTLAVIKKYNWKIQHMIAYVAVVSLAGEFIVNNVTFPENGMTYVLGLLVGSFEASFFPYCSWIIYPIAGYIFGTALRDCKDKNGFYISVAKYSIPICTAMMAYAAGAQIEFGQLQDEYQTAYYHMGIYGNICLLSFVFGWLSVCYLVSRIMPSGVVDYFKKLSSNITKIYVLQYVMIIYTYVFIANEESNAGIIEVLLISTIIFIVSERIARLKPMLPMFRLGRVSSNKAV